MYKIKKDAKILGREESHNDSNENDYRQLLQAITFKYVDTFRVDKRVPFRLENQFRNKLQSFAGATVEKLLSTSNKAVTDGLEPLEAVETAKPVLVKSARQLAGVIENQEQTMAKHTILVEQHLQGYPFFMFVSDMAESTCGECSSRNGEIFTVSELLNHLPPLHPNCRCRIVAMDNEALRRYNMSGRSFYNQVLSAIANQPWNSDELYVLNHSFNLYGIGADTLTPLKLPRKPLITVAGANGISKPWYQGITDWAGNFSDDVQALWASMYGSAQERSAHMFDSVPNFLDWLTGGIFSGLYNTHTIRGEMARNDRSVYNVANWLLWGIPEMIRGTVIPEEPLSLQHFMDSIGTALLLYGTYRLVQRNAAIRAATRAAEASTPSANNWTRPDGSTWYPENEGFADMPEITVLEPGEMIDRFGGEMGRYAAPLGTPYGARAMPPGYKYGMYNIYEVLKPLEVNTGITAPWFGTLGGGVQYQFSNTIEELIRTGFIRRLP